MIGMGFWQPWASLIAVGAKRVETRHWPVDPKPARNDERKLKGYVGDRIAIYATKSNYDHGKTLSEPVRRALGGEPGYPDELPTGCIVATAVVVRCSRMTVASIEALRRAHPDEHAFGWYEAGRYAWVLADVDKLARPLPFKSKSLQGWFRVAESTLRQGDQAAML